MPPGHAPLNGYEGLDAHVASLSLDQGYIPVSDRRSETLPVEER